MQSEAKHSRPLRRILKAAGLGSLVLIAAAIVFHRPLFFEGTRYFIVRAAKQQHIDLEYEISGSIFTTLSISNLRGVPTEPGPVERLEVGRLDLRYSLPGLIRKGLPGFLEDIVVRDVFVELAPAEPLAPEKRRQPQAFKFPALFPRTLDVANINLIAHGPSGDTVIERLSLGLFPRRVGALSFARLAIPGFRDWRDVEATTEYRERRLILRGFHPEPGIAVTSLELDASHLEDSRLALAVDADLVGANTSLRANIADLNKSNTLTGDAQISGLDLARLGEFLAMANAPAGRLDTAEVRFAGEIGSPLTWNARASLKVGELAYQGHPIGTLSLEAGTLAGNATAVLRIEGVPANTVAVDARARLAEKSEDLAKSDASGSFEIRLGDPGAIVPNSRGSLTANGTFSSADGMQASLAATGSDLAFEGFRVDSLALDSRFADGALDVARLALSRAANSLDVTGRLVLPKGNETFADARIDAAIALDAPDLSEFRESGAPQDLSGRLAVHGNVAGVLRNLGGAFNAEGRTVRAGGLAVQELRAGISIENGLIRVADGSLVFDERNAIQAEGTLSLAEPHDYTGSLSASFGDIAIFRPLLGTNPAPLGGSVHTIWAGSGTLSPAQHAGSASFDARGVRFGEITGAAASGTASYDGWKIRLPRVQASAFGFDASLAASSADGRLRLERLDVTRTGRAFASGTAEIPFHPGNPFPTNEPLQVNASVPGADIVRTLAALGQKDPPVSGNVMLNLSANGTLDTLSARLELRGSGLHAKAAPELRPTSLSLNATLSEKSVDIDGTIANPVIQPLRISGTLPLDVAALVTGKPFDPDLPLDFRATLPRSSFAFLPTIVPVLRTLRGGGGFDLRARGTLSKPELAGSFDTDIASLRFADPSLPPVNRVAARIGFAGNRITINRCDGLVAGGTFSAGGAIDITNPADPVFSLRLGSKNALALQNDDLTVRISSDIRVTGPLRAGSVDGTVWVVRSRFFRNIEILPIGLPGRPAPQPPPEPQVNGIQDPPLRDWKLNVAVKTADPFLVQGNLADGRITMDLRLLGTGREPWLDGVVTIDELTTSLPFSRLRFRDGQVFFTRQQPFIPQLNLTGTSSIRSYDVNVLLTGPATAPEAIFTSNPPLPQSEVVSLIATGVTTEELGRNPNALAGRAAILALRQLYERVFHRNRPPPENESFLDRIEFDIGTTNPRTGAQATGVRIPLTEQIVLTGGADVGGNFQGQVKYLIRFR